LVLKHKFGFGAGIELALRHNSVCVGKLLEKALL